MAQSNLNIILTLKDLATKELRQFNDNVQSSFKQATDASEKFAKGLAITAGGFLAFAGYGLKVQAELETARQGFITLLGSAQKADDIIAQIKKDASATPFEINGLVQANQLLTSVTKDADKSERFLLNIGKALASMGKGQPELDRIIINLQQIGSVGKASMLDIKQFAFAGIPIFELLKERFGDVESAIENGQVTFEVLQDIFNKAGEEGGRFADAFKNQSGTFSQSFSNMKDSLAVFSSEFVKQTGIFDSFKSAMQGLTNLVSDDGQRIIDFFKKLGDPQMRIALVLISGAILGALVPAMIALATSILGVIVPLLPFMAIGALVAGVIYGMYKGITYLIDNWDNLKNAVGGALNFIVEKITAFGGFLSGVWNSIWGFIKTVAINTLAFLIGSIITLLDFFVPQWREILEGIKNVIVNVFNFIKDAVLIVWNGLITVLKTTWTALSGWIKTAMEYTSGVIKSVWNGISEFFKGIWDGIKDTFKQAIDWIMKKIQPLLDALDRLDIGGKSKSLWGNLKGGISDIVSKGKGAMGVNDAIIAPNGNIITTHPDDYLIATKNPQSLGGGKGVTQIHLHMDGREIASVVYDQMTGDLLKNVKLA